MKKILFTLMLSFTIIAFPNNSISEDLKNEEKIIQSDYCEGWDDGYCEGWKDVKGEYSICPITPICPIPELGKNSYRDGYNRGFKAGWRAANR